MAEIPQSLPRVVEKLLWKCSLGHNWEATVANRTKGSGCGICANYIIVSGVNDLATLYPRLAIQADGWEPRKVGPTLLKPFALACESLRAHNPHKTRSIQHACSEDLPYYLQMPIWVFRGDEMIARNLIKGKKATTVVLVFFFSLFGIQSGHAAYYPSGPQLNVPVSTVTSGGWTLCFQEDFGTTGTPVATMLNECTGKNIMLAGKFNADDDIKVLAAGERSAVFQVQTDYNEKTLNNGTYFYFFPVASSSVYSEEYKTKRYSLSIGFSLSIITDVYTCDWWDEEPPLAEYRLCRHIRNGEQFSSGYLIGSTQDVNSMAMFQVYQQSIPEEKVTKPAPALRQTHNLRFDQSFYGSDQISDPTGEISNILKEINRKYGYLIK